MKTKLNQIELKKKKKSFAGEKTRFFWISNLQEKKKKKTGIVGFRKIESIQMWYQIKGKKTLI